MFEEVEDRRVLDERFRDRRFLDRRFLDRRLFSDHVRDGGIGEDRREPASDRRAHARRLAPCRRLACA